jgi:tetratricopeptide (TPR) repeat protein
LKVLKINPNHVYAWSNKGISLNELQRFNEAIACYDKALEISPNHAIAWSNKRKFLDYLRKKM